MKTIIFLLILYFSFQISPINSEHYSLTGKYSEKNIEFPKTIKILYYTLQTNYTKIDIFIDQFVQGEWKPFIHDKGPYERVNMKHMIKGGMEDVEKYRFFIKNQEKGNGEPEEFDVFGDMIISKEMHFKVDYVSEYEYLKEMNVDLFYDVQFVSITVESNELDVESVLYQEKEMISKQFGSKVYFMNARSPKTYDKHNLRLEIIYRNKNVTQKCFSTVYYSFVFGLPTTDEKPEEIISDLHLEENDIFEFPLFFGSEMIYWVFSSTLRVDILLDDKILKTIYPSEVADISKGKYRSMLPDKQYYMRITNAEGRLSSISGTLITKPTRPSKFDYVRIIELILKKRIGMQMYAIKEYVFADTTYLEWKFHNSNTTEFSIYKYLGKQSSTTVYDNEKTPLDDSGSFKFNEKGNYYFMVDNPHDQDIDIHLEFTYTINDKSNPPTPPKPFQWWVLVIIVAVVLIGCLVVCVLVLCFVCILTKKRKTSGYEKIN